MTSRIPVARKKPISEMSSTGQGSLAPEIVPEPSQYNRRRAEKLKGVKRRMLASLMIAIAAAFLFSMKPIFVKLAYNYAVDSTTLMTLRMVFSLPFFILFGLIARRQRRKANLKTDFSRKTILMTGLTGILGYYFASWFDLEGLTYITAQFERLILFTFPVLVAILNLIIFRISLPRQTILPIVLSYIGLAIIFAHDLQTFGKDVITGSVLVGLAALFFALYLVLSKSLIVKTGSRLFTSIAMSAASVMIIFHFLLLKDFADLLSLQGEVYITALAIAVISTVMPAFLINEAIARLGSQKTSIVGTIGPVFTTLVAIYVLGEPFSIFHAIGMGLVILGIYLLSAKK